jgi:tetratricopeptide (TPR) repeat protein
MSCLRECFQRKVETETVVDSLLQAMKKQIDKSSHVMLEMIDGKRSVFFVGAGASVASGLPNFRQFSEHMLSNLLTTTNGSVSKTDISMFVSELRPEVLLQTLQEVFGDKIFDFYDWFDDAVPSTNHYVLARALKEGGLVLTTNVDILIETAYEDLYGDNDFQLLVRKEDFERFSTNDTTSKGTLMKFHGTVDVTKTGPARYDTVRFLLDQVGMGMSTGMHKVLTEVCKNYDMIYLGYSGCDNFSVQPVICHTATDRTTLWMWFEWREQMVLEHSSVIYEKELSEVGKQVSEGQSFSEIERGMETLSTCEILVERLKALRFRGKISEVMDDTALPEHKVVADAVSSTGPVPNWTKSICSIDRLRCAAKLYSKAMCLEEGIKCLEEANHLASFRNDKFVKAQISKELGNEYANESTADSYEKAHACYDTALGIFEAIGNYIKVMETKLDKVNVLRRTRHFDEAETLLKSIDIRVNDGEEIVDSFVDKILIRRELMEGLILGMGRQDKDSRNRALSIFEQAAQLAAKGGFVSLQAAILNASGLVKYQMAGNAVKILQGGARDLDAAFRLNIYIGDARACFQQLRNLGLIHVKLSRLTNDPKLLEQAIEEFKRGEKFLFRLSKNRIMGELLEIRFRLGESLVEAGRYVEAQPILARVREQRMKSKDWHNEARTLELLVKCAANDDEELIERVNQIKEIYEDALTNVMKQERFEKQPITTDNGRQILHTASTQVKFKDIDLSMELAKLSFKLFGN